MLEDVGSPEKLVEDTELTQAQVRLAVVYRNVVPAEIEEAVADNRRPLDDLRTLFPFIEVVDV